MHPVGRVLFEQKVDGYWCGHTASFIEVRVKCDKDLHGIFADVKFTENKGEYLFGKLF